MTERLVHIDAALLADAQSVLGTATDEDTVNRALRDVIRRRRSPQRDTPEVLAAFAEATVDLADPDVMRAAWFHGGGPLSRGTGAVRSVGP